MSGLFRFRSASSRSTRSPPPGPLTPQQPFFSPKLGPSRLSTTSPLQQKHPPIFYKSDETSGSNSQERETTLSNLSTSSAIPGPTRPHNIPNTPPPSSSSLNRTPIESVNLSESGWKHNSGTLNLREEVLMSLMASEAVVDSCNFDILTAAEVGDFKKVRNIQYIYGIDNRRQMYIGTSTIDFTS